MLNIDVNIGIGFMKYNNNYSLQTKSNIRNYLLKNKRINSMKSLHLILLEFHQKKDQNYSLIAIYYQMIYPIN